MSRTVSGFRFAAITAAVLTLTLGLSACQSKIAKEDLQGDQVVTLDKVDSGDEFSVVLKSYPKKGKVWSFDAQRTVGPVKLLSSRYRRAEMPENDSRFFKPLFEAADECEQEFVFKRTGCSSALLYFTRANSEKDQPQEQELRYLLPRDLPF